MFHIANLNQITQVRAVRVIIAPHYQRIAGTSKS
jgi:hypothetical protein